MSHEHERARVGEQGDVGLWGFVGVCMGGGKRGGAREEETTYTRQWVKKNTFTTILYYGQEARHLASKALGFKPEVTVEKRANVGEKNSLAQCSRLPP